MSSFIKKIQNGISRYDLLEKHDKILLAVSGGPDSICLLDVFSKLQDKYALELAVAHVNYSLRGHDSDTDEKFVRNLARKYEFKIFILKTDPQKTSENILRDIRYDFLEKIRNDNNFDLIAVAHNADDQVETFFLRLLRGSGLQGLAAMKHKNEKIIRPLLGITRPEIKKYLRENNLSFRMDKTNLESQFLRNKIRNQLIPYLDKNYNPQIKKTVFDSLESIGEDLDFLNIQTEKVYRKNKVLSARKMLALHPAIRRRLILTAIYDKRKDLKDIEFAHVAEIEKILKSNKNKRQRVLFKGLKVTRSGDKIKIEKLNS